MKLRLLLLTLLLTPFSAHAVPLIQEARLDSGLRILLMEAHNVPMVSMQLSMVAGSRFDPDGKGGTASLLAAMLSDHTARHGHIAWADMLDAGALRLGGGVSRDEFSISLTVLREMLEPGMESLAEALLHPGWSKKRFAILKQDALSAARKAQEEPGVRAAEAAATLLFNAHPYGHRPSGSLASLKAIELSGLKLLYRAQVKPQGAVLAVSGNITMAELKPLVAKLFANWKGAPKKGLGDIPAPKGAGGKQRDIELPTSQTQLQLLRLGPPRSSGAFFPIFVLNHILGGGSFGSRLMEELREKRGLTYGVYSYFSPLATHGPFVISLQTRGAQADEAERVIRKLMTDMAAGNIDNSQLEAARKNLAGSFAQRMDSNRERVGLLAMMGLYSLPLDYLSRWVGRVNAVTLAEVRQQAAAYLNPDEWGRIRVGASLK